ncbi:MAG: cytochrome b/b6 domain-containing protein [Deltaproteobacteria bacterium]|nr:cytochrome b/b6 domain-containing protein [Deltaproteobacteria bacterium]
MVEPCYRPHKVWDPLLRALHWWNAAAVLILITLGTTIMVLGEELPHAVEDELITVHAAFGFLFGAGLMVRIIWLFTGPETARWKDLLPVTAKKRKVFWDTVRFYGGFLRGASPLYKAHNPFAGIVYAFFFAVASVQVISGAVTFNLPDKLRDKSVFLEVHETVYFLIIIYVATHVFAVVVHELVEGHGLISSMVNGNKAFTDGEWESLEDD